MARQVQGPGRRSQSVRLRDQASRARLGTRPRGERPGRHVDRPDGGRDNGHRMDRPLEGHAGCRAQHAENREYLLRRFLLPHWGTRQLNSLTGEEITVWENGLPGAAGVSRRTAKDARSLLHTILGDAASARPPLIPFNPAVRPRNRGRRTGRRLDRSPQRIWATPLEILLVAERAALLTGRDDEFTMLVTIGYSGMRWGETIGLERDLLLPTLINVEWQLREIRGRFFRLPPKDDSYRSTSWEPLVPVDIPAFLAGLLAPQADKHARQRCACAREHGGTGRYVFFSPDGSHYRRSNFARRVFRPACDGRYEPVGAGLETWSSWTLRRGRAARSRRGHRRYPGGRSVPHPAEAYPIWSAWAGQGTAHPAGERSSYASTGRPLPTRPRCEYCPGSGKQPRDELPSPAGCRSRTG